MNKLGVRSAIALVLLGVAHGQAVKDPLWSNQVRLSSRAQLIASLEQAMVRPGDPITLHFRLRNVSSRAINLTWGAFDENYWLMVTDVSGTELPRTKEGDRLRQPSKVEISAISGPLAPGADDGDHSIDLTKHYQLDRPGNCFVRIARRIGVPPDVPAPRTVDEIAKAPLEEAVSDLIPFTIAP